MKCLIVDDEPYAVNLLEEYIQQTTYLKLAGKCYNAVEALTFLQKEEADLIFLDINMPHLSGIQLAGLLTDYKIIFTTAYSKYAVESYELNAVDYLLKPITFERFVKAVQKAAQENKPTTGFALKPSDSTIFVKSGKAVIKIELTQIRYIEALGDYVAFHLENEKHAMYKRMKDLETTLPEQFCRIHNSYIVNMQHIAKIEDKLVHIKQTELPISEKYHDDFWAKVQARVFR